MPKDFKPPKYAESHVYVFDRKTGEILATHTHWVDAGAERSVDDISRELLESIAQDADRAPNDLDVLHAKARAGNAAVRVDVKTRKLVAERRPKNDRLLMPGPLARP